MVPADGEGVQMAEEPILRVRTSRPRPDVGLIEVEGELDGSTVVRLREELEAAADAAHVAVDLGGITFVDSSGIEALVRAHHRHAGRLHLLGVQRSRAATRVLDLFGLTAEFAQQPDVDALLTSLR